MRAGEARLSIDCGSAATVAVLAWADGSASALSFDGLPYLPSSVFLAADGQVWTGQQAWQAAGAQPSRLIPSPRRPADNDLATDGASVDALGRAAAPLRRVAAEAERVAGGPVRDVRLVVPAGWGPRRRSWMRQAAHRAGLLRPRLVEAPVAVAITGVGEAQQLVAMVLQGGQPGPLLQALEAIKQVLVLAVARTGGARQAIEAAIAQARQLGSSGN
ncbi:DUF6244 family protein [Micromonospora aurantiaca (nom. illeg.)]|uniref:DUF6244 family protein n=1 Tax=Micromonospora aurantiaca (nom. illeg.) TaxID=47850 RepID=UPI0036D1F989